MGYGIFPSRRVIIREQGTWVAARAQSGFRMQLEPVPWQEHAFGDVQSFSTGMRVVRLAGWLEYRVLGVTQTALLTEPRRV